MNNVILISTNGFDGTWPAIEYGAWVAEVISADIVLLGVSEAIAEETGRHNAALEDVLQRAAALFAEKGIHHTIETQQGRSEEVVPRFSNEIDGLTILGPLGRPLLRRLLFGRSIRSLLETIPTPILYVPRVCLPMQKILICLGGLGYEITAEHLALRLGSAAGAQATLLHVARPVDLEYPTARVEREHWRDLENTDSLLGRNLRAGLEAARAVGMTAAIKARQGNVAEEILAEMRAGDYDLVCMGSPHGFGGLRHLYEPNITEEVAENAPCPLLTARYVQVRSPGLH